MEKWQLFALGAALAWGLYGPALQHGSHTLAFPAGAAHNIKLTPDQLAAGRMKALLGVGIAYFLLAVLLPVVLLIGDTKEGIGFSPGMILLTVAGGAGALAGVSLMMAQQFNTEGTVGSLVAGALGAIGAIAVIYALSSGGSPAAVMPTVFGTAPLINVAASYLWDKFYLDKSLKSPEPLFFVGIVLAAVGAGLVLAYKPAPNPPKAPGAAPAPGQSAAARPAH
jgi:hypothetical protein